MEKAYEDLCGALYHLMYSLSDDVGSTAMITQEQQEMVRVIDLYFDKPVLGYINAWVSNDFERDLTCLYESLYGSVRCKVKKIEDES